MATAVAGAKLKTMNAAANSLLPALIGLAIFVLIIARQFTTRRLTLTWMFLLPAGLAVYGLSSIQGLDAAGVALLGLNSALAAVLGAVRGSTIRVWSTPTGDVFMKGTLLTVIFWAITIAVRIGVYAFERDGGQTIQSSGAALLIPIAITIGVQNVVVYLRSQRLSLAAA
jgi:hypothetical protein